MKNQNLVGKVFNVNHAYDYINNVHIIKQCRVIVDMTNEDTNIVGELIDDPKHRYTLGELQVKFGKFYDAN